MALESKGDSQVPFWPKIVLIVLIVIFYAVGIIVSLISSFIPAPEPNSWSYWNWQRIGIVPIITILASAVLLFYLLKGKDSAKKTLILTTVGLTILATILFQLKYAVKDGSIKFDGYLVAVITAATWLLAFLLLAVVPLICKTKSKSLDKQWTHYVLLTTIVMWLAPLLAETIIGLNWYLHGTYIENLGKGVWGGGGFSDFLFVLGFVTLISGLLSMLALKILNRH